jgi:peroxiredoxin (alkyl hydroperoxide reductase subunit C)
MKKLSLMLITAFMAFVVHAQSTGAVSGSSANKEDRNFRIPLLGDQAPSFTAKTTMGTLNFPSDYGRKWKILLSHPQDFTPVCSSELLDLAYLQDEFDKVGAKLVVVSTDNLETHEQWVKALEEIRYKDRQPVTFRFPLVDDHDQNVSKKYGMIHSASATTKDVRGVFVIDPENVVRAFYFYPMNVGRNTAELVRTVEALQATASGEFAAPSGWKKGEDLLVHSHPNSDANNPEALPPDYYKVAWFMIYKKNKAGSEQPGN